MVMPFVVCESQGGPYDDAAPVAGFEMGELDAQLNVAAVSDVLTMQRTLRSASLPQVDLVAMRHGFRLKVIAHHDNEWSTVTFRQSKATQEINEMDDDA